MRKPDAIIIVEEGKGVVEIIEPLGEYTNEHGTIEIFHLPLRGAIVCKAPKTMTKEQADKAMKEFMVMQLL